MALQTEGRPKVKRTQDFFFIKPHLFICVHTILKYITNESREWNNSTVTERITTETQLNLLFRITTQDTNRSVLNVISKIFAN